MSVFIEGYFPEALLVTYQDMVWHETLENCFLLICDILKNLNSDWTLLIPFFSFLYFRILRQFGMLSRLWLVAGDVGGSKVTEDEVNRDERWENHMDGFHIQRIVMSVVSVSVSV